MKKIDIRLEVSQDNILFPKRATLYSAGYDVFASHSFTIEAHGTRTIEIPYVFTYNHLAFSETKLHELEILFTVRSSYGINKKLRFLTKEGNLLKNYTHDSVSKQISITLYNDSSEPLVIPKDEHFLQFLLTFKNDPKGNVDFEKVSSKVEEMFPSLEYSVIQKENTYSLVTHEDILLMPKEQLVLPSGWKAHFENDLWLTVDIDESYNHAISFANSMPVIDADYYNNPKNEGLIFLGIVNSSDEKVVIKRDSVLCHFTAKPFYLLSNDIPPVDSRNGGIGSTTTKK